jgi:lipopolysaccharide assembly outer membrane protein LptD (OstA)
MPVDEPPLGPDELRIRSNRQEGGQGKLHYEGFVDLRFGQLRIQADALDMFDETKPDGTSAQRIEASGNVVFMSGQERISGETLRLDLDTGKGLFTKASGYLQPDVLFEAESIESRPPSSACGSRACPLRSSFRTSSSPSTPTNGPPGCSSRATVRAN